MFLILDSNPFPAIPAKTSWPVLINEIISSSDSGSFVSYKLKCPTLDLSKEYFICKINGQIKELTYKLTERHDNKNLEFLGLEQKEASKAYETTLRYIIGMAFYKLYPNLKIRFSYFVSRSIFCEVLTPGISLSNIYKDIENSNL